MLSIKPDFVVHGDDWKTGFRKNIRLEVVNLLKLWGGKLVEIPFTKDISSTKMNNHIKSLGVSPDTRCKQLRRLISSKKIKLLDWRQDFSGNIFFGDIYYDFAKLLHGMIVSHEIVKNNGYNVKINRSKVILNIKKNKKKYRVYKPFF